MSKVKSVYRCSACEATAPQWAGRCATCGEWNTMVEALPSASAPRVSAGVALTPVSINQAVAEVAVAFPTGLGEVDRVLGGGLTPGSVTLLGGEPGIGKSTLVLQICQGLADSGRKCLVVTGEESAEQVGRRARRLGITHPNIALLAASDVASIIASIDATRPDFVIIDSVQTMSVSDLSSASGTVSQVREVAQAFTTLAKSRRVAVVLIGHVTKDGNLAGPRVLEHVVDTVLEFEGDRHHGLRFLRAVKHRFGATDEVGVLAMAEHGLESVADASGMFLDDRREGTDGSIVAPVLNGRRPMLVEVQALVDHESTLPQPRRVGQGLNTARFAVMCGVLSRKAKFPLYNSDVFTSVVGGLRIDDPGCDLAACLAIASSAGETAIAHDYVAIGEVGLGGEIRKVPQMDKRLAEAQRMGFKRALVPAGYEGEGAGLKLFRIPTLRAAIDGLQIRNPPPPKKRE